MLRRELADLPLQLGNAAGVLHRRQRYSAAANAGKRKVTLGSPLSAPAFQQMRTHLVFARHLCVSGTCVQRPHGGDFEITTVNSSGQIHFLAPFNVFGPLTPCLIFGVHSSSSGLCGCGGLQPRRQVGGDGQCELVRRRSAGDGGGDRQGGGAPRSSGSCACGGLQPRRQGGGDGQRKLVGRRSAGDRGGGRRGG